MPDLTIDISTVPNLNSISSWTTSDYAALTAKTISQMTLSQIASIGHIDWVQPSGVSGFTAEHIRAMTIDFYWISSDWLNGLNAEAIKALNATQIGQIQSGYFKALDNTHLSAFTAAQVASMTHLNTLSSEQFGLLDISALSPSAIAGLSQTEFAGLTVHQVASLSQEQIQSMKRVEWLSDAVVSTLNPAQIAALGDNLARLTPAQVVAMNHLDTLSSSQFDKLNLSGLSTAAIAELTAAQYASLSAGQLAALSTEQIHALQHIEWLPATAIGGLTAAQLSSLSNETLSRFSAEQVGALKHINALSGEQFGLLDISGLSNAAMGSFNDQQYKGLTAAQIVSLSTEQINAMAHLSSLGNEAIAGLTPEQIKNCKENFYWFSPEWFNHLSEATFQAIKPENMGQIFLPAFEGLDATRRSQLTANQIGGITYNFYFFSPEWFNSLSPEAIKGITTEQLNQLQTSNFTHWDNAHLAALTAAQVAVAPHLGSLSSEQFGLLDISALSPSAIAGLSQTEFAGLTVHQVASLSQEQIQSMKRVEWLSDAVVSTLNPAQIAALGDNLSRLTPAQVVAMNHLDTLSSSQFDKLNLSGLSTAAIAELTAAQYASLSAGQLAALSTEQIHALQHIEWLPATAVSGLTAAQLSSLSNETLSRFSAVQVGALKHINALSGEQFCQLDISGLSVSTIQSWSSDQIKEVTGKQIASLSVEQVLAIAHIDWVQPSGVSGFTAEHIRAMTIDFYWISSDWLNGLSAEAIKALNATQIGQIQSGYFKALDNTHLSAFTAAQVASMTHLNTLSSEQFGLLDISALSPSTIAGLSQTEYAGLTVHQVASLSQEQIQSMKRVEWLSDAVVSALNPAQIAALGDNLARLTPAQVVAMNHLDTLSSSQFDKLNLSGLSTAAIAELTAEQYASLSAGQLAALSTEQIHALQHIEWLPATAVGGLTAAQLSSLSNETLSRFSAEQVGALTHTNALSGEQFSKLDISGLSASAIQNWSSEQIKGVSAKQIASLSVEQIQAIAHIDWISDTTAIAFTPEQLQGIETSMKWFSSAWLNNLSIETFQAMTPAQAGQISSEALAALDNEHLHALTAEQIGGMNNFGKLTSPQFGLLDISRLSNAAIGSFNDQQYKGLTAAQIVSLSTEQINAMAHLSSLGNEAIAGLTPEQIKNYKENFYWFSPEWFNHLSEATFQAIKPENMGQIFLPAFEGLDATRRSQLTANQIGGITYNFYFFSPEWFNSLSPEAIKGITTEQLNQLQTTNFTHWDNAHLAALTAAQVAVAPHLGSLSSEQFGLLDISKLSISAIENLSKTEYQGLTANQISSLSAEQIQALHHLSWISAAATKGFTAVQMQNFGNDISGLSASFLNNLSIDVMTTFTPSQLNSMNSVAFAGLDYDHFSALGDLSGADSLLSSLTTDQLLTVSPLMSMQQQSMLSESQQLLISTATDAGFSLIDNIHDPILKNCMNNAVSNDISLFNFTTIESVLKDFASQMTGTLSESQFNDIKNYVQAIDKVCGTDSVISSLVNGLIGTDGASINLTLLAKGKRIGSLQAGSRVYRFNQLISAWFDGANVPEFSSSSHVDGRPLFAKGGPSINDIQQGGSGDCALLSALQAVVNVAPDFIKSMIVQNPNDTYSVRFFKDGVAHWVTVDGNVNENGTQSATSSWAAIVERANVAFEATWLDDRNNYSSLPGGFGKLQEITGDTYTSFRALTTSEEKWNTTDFELLKTAVMNGAPAQFFSWKESKNDLTGQTNLVNAHAYAIIGFDESTQDFILSNPWGAFLNDNVQGTFEASMDLMWQEQNANSGIAFTNLNTVSDAAGQLVHAMAAINTSPSAALDTSALAINLNNSMLAASHN